MSGLRAYRAAALGSFALAFAGVALASPQLEFPAQPAPAERSVAALDTPSLSVRPKPVETMTCPQRCDSRAEQTLKTCLRTVAALQSDPNWMDDALNADSCGKAAVAGADQCRKRCGDDAVAKMSRPVAEIDD